MNREEIIKLAQEAEFPAANYPSLVSDNDWKALERFAAIVAAEEREACAKVCETEWSTLGQMEASSVFAAAIRARGQS